MLPACERIGRSGLRHLRADIVLLVTALLLGSCQTAPLPDVTATPPPTSVSPQDATLRRAESAPPDVAASLYLSVGESALSAGDLEVAQDVFERIDPALLPADEAARYDLLGAELAALTGNTRYTDTLLGALPADSTHAAPGAQQRMCGTR